MPSPPQIGHATLPDSQEVAEKLTRAMADRDGGLVFDADNMKVGEYLERWLADSVLDTVRPRLSSATNKSHAFT
jgi:hypothetical protein